MQLGDMTDIVSDKITEMSLKREYLLWKLSKAITTPIVIQNLRRHVTLNIPEWKKPPHRRD